MQCKVPGVIFNRDILKETKDNVLFPISFIFNRNRLIEAHTVDHGAFEGGVRRKRSVGQWSGRGNASHGGIALRRPRCSLLAS